MQQKGKFISVRGKLDNDRIISNYGPIFRIDKIGIIDTYGYFLLYQAPNEFTWKLLNMITFSNNPRCEKSLNS